MNATHSWNRHLVGTLRWGVRAAFSGATTGDVIPAAEACRPLNAGGDIAARDIAARCPYLEVTGSGRVFNKARA
jgi:hypothetical protein